MALVIAMWVFQPEFLLPPEFYLYPCTVSFPMTVFHSSITIQQLGYFTIFSSVFVLQFWFFPPLTHPLCGSIHTLSYDSLSLIPPQSPLLSAAYICIPNLFSVLPIKLPPLVLSISLSLLFKSNPPSSKTIPQCSNPRQVKFSMPQ